jgi:hypothetical protein
VRFSNAAQYHCLVCLRYILALHTYLTSFMHRTQPLVDIESKQTATIEEFNKKWEEGEFEGWTDVNQRPQVDGTVEGIWCAACKYSIICYTPLFYPLPRPKDVFKANRLRCPSHLEKAYQSYF